MFIDRFHYTNNYITSKQILLANNKNRDVSGNFMPNLIYVSREKNTASHHRFKAGALNVLVWYSIFFTIFFYKKKQQEYSN